MNGPKIYFTIPLLGGIDITQTTVSSFVVMVLLCTAAVVLGGNLQKRPGRRQVLVEKGVTMLYDMVESTMGKHNSYWTPYIGALFLSSICGSFIGMTGIFRSSTADLSTTFTWALMTSFLCWGCSIKRNGVYDEIMGILNAAGKRIVEFSGIMSNPTYAKVQEGAKLAWENHVDLILAVGGGLSLIHI